MLVELDAIMASRSGGDHTAPFRDFERPAAVKILRGQSAFVQNTFK